MKKLEFRNGTVSVGDVFASSWGYEQTNVGFYQVISTHGKKTVCIRPIDSEVIYINANSYLIPIFDAFIGNDIYKSKLKIMLLNHVFRLIAARTRINMIRMRKRKCDLRHMANG